jgi:hypothetical protein
MKPKLLLFTLLSFYFCLLSSQIPQGFNYQAIARDASGNPIINTVLPVRITIQSDSLGGTTFWIEEHSTVTTNSLGLFTLILGKGVKKTGSTVATFNDIDWTVSPKFIKTEIDYSGWKTMGSSRLWSVPYSMVSGSLAGPVKKLAVTGETSVMDEALFEVKNKTGQTVFAVYNEGVRVYVDDGVAKGVKGGFAIGGFGTAKAPSQNYFVVKPDTIRMYIDDTPGKAVKGGFAIGGFGTGKGTSQHLFVVNPDSIRAYIDTNTGKGVKGGFAIGGFGTGKAPGEQYLRITRDSTRINVRELAKGVKGGFAIGGFSGLKGTVTPFTSLTPENYFIGHRSGSANIAGLYNSFLGYETGPDNSGGSNNALFGYQAGFKNSSGSNNLFLGYQSGYSNVAGNFNSFMGYKAGNQNTSGDKNSFVGSYAGLNNSIGENNSFIGYNAGLLNQGGSSNNFFGTGSGYSNISGNSNVFMGPESGYLNESGNFNTFIGYRTGYSNKSSYNVFLGFESGYSNSTGNPNVFIGYQAGRANNSGTNNIFIGNQAGLNNTTGYDNVYIGDSVGVGVAGTKGYSNVFIGNNCGKEITDGLRNVSIGNLSGRMISNGQDNVFIGHEAGEMNTTGYGNILIGFSAGQKTNGLSNVMIGASAGTSHTSGINNIFLGYHAGFSNSIGSGNILIGGKAGYLATGSANIFIGNYAGFNETGSQKLYIDNSGASTPLIYGDFDADYVTINGALYTTGSSNINNTTIGAQSIEINASGSGDRDAFIDFHADNTNTDFAFRVARWPGVNGQANIYQVGTGPLGISTMNAAPINFYTSNTHRMTITPSGFVGIGTAAPGAFNLYVNGTSCSTGGWTVSDLRWKKDIEPLGDVIREIVQLNGVMYSWRREEFPEKNFESGTQIGLIAQDVEKIFPQLVKTNDDGYKAVAYDKLSAVLLEGIKEQQKIITDQQSAIESLKGQLSSLQEKVYNIETLLLKSGAK